MNIQKYFTEIHLEFVNALSLIKNDQNVFDEPLIMTFIKKKKNRILSLSYLVRKFDFVGCNNDNFI